MYLVSGDAGFDAGCLRQGDILSGIPFPLLEHGKIRVLGGLQTEDHCGDGLPDVAVSSIELNKDKNWVTIQVPARFGFCAILTHCCELEPRNGKIRNPMLTLARLRPIPDDIRNNAPNFASLRANKDSSDALNRGYKEYFYLDAHERIEGKDWSIHFNQVVTLPTSDIAVLLARKVLQMNDRTRAKFKTKLAYSAGKYTDEEIAAGLDNPWAEPAPPLEPTPPAENEPPPPALV